MRILAARPGRTRTGHDHTCLGAAGYHLLRTAVKCIEGDEITALRLGPSADAETAEFALQNLLDHLELRTQDIRVLSHVLDHAVDILEEADVAQLVHLVVTYGLDPELLLDVIEIVQRGSERRNAGAREAYLRGRSELIDKVRIARALALRENLDDRILIEVIEVMNRVGIVPVKTEILGRGL